MSKLWIWNWTEGGYNYTTANTKEEAEHKAVEMAKRTTLHVNMATMHEGNRKELDRLDKMYGNYWD